MPEKISYSSLERISRVLLVFGAVFFTLSVFLAVRSYTSRQAVERLRAQLLSQVELQEQLLSSQAADQSVYPHLEKKIGYVLNPYMKRSTWRADPGGEGYRINSIGLRGQEIGPKAKGSTRILLLGDSLLFGWKLGEEDTVASVMNRYLSAQFPDDGIEVVTAAMPSWNVISEAAFLEHHFNVLRPDLIVWGLARNDAGDVSGVIPPGRLAQWNSPQTVSHAALSLRAELHRDLAMPAILERWDRNLSAVQEVRERYGLPVILLWIRAQQRPFFEFVMERRQMAAPTVFVPGRFRHDTSSWCISESDCHPNHQATRIIALGILDKLARMGRVPVLDLDPAEQDVVEAFRAEEARTPAPEQIEEFLAGRLAQVPSQWRLGDPQVGDSVLYGLNLETGRIMKNGVLFLRAPDSSSVLELDLKTTPNPRGVARSAVFTVRNRDGEAARQVVELGTGPAAAGAPAAGTPAAGTPAAGRRAIRVSLPVSEPGAVYELLWQFDYADCVRPDFCYSGRLLGVTFRR